MKHSESFVYCVQMNVPKWISLRRRLHFLNPKIGGCVLMLCDELEKALGELPETDQAHAEFVTTHYKQLLTLPPETGRASVTLLNQMAQKVLKQSTSR